MMQELLCYMRTECLLIIWIVCSVIVIADLVFVFIKRKKLLSRIVKDAIWNLLFSPIVAPFIVSIWLLDLCEWISDRMYGKGDSESGR